MRERSRSWCFDGAYSDLVMFVNTLWTGFTPLLSVSLLRRLGKLLAFVVHSILCVNIILPLWRRTFLFKYVRINSIYNKL